MKIYKCNISDVSENELNKWFDEMSKERREETERLIVKEKRASKIVADHLCRKAVSEFCGVSPDTVEFTKNEYGKPFAKNLPVHFSISHSGDIVVCAVSDKEIGIDIEIIKSFNLKTAEKFATDSEFEYIKSNENGFFEIWTLKEAYFKCIGTGLSGDIKNVSFDITPSGIICSEHEFECSFVNLDNNYICSVCKK